MFGYHKHDWQQPEGYKVHEETRPYGTHGFVRTIYFHIQQCATCGKQRKDIYNDWIHKPENDPDPNSEWAASHASIAVLGGLGYEEIT
jgi:hypothetical protein